MFGGFRVAKSLFWPTMNFEKRLQCLVRLVVLRQGAFTLTVAVFTQLKKFSRRGKGGFPVWLSTYPAVVSVSQDAS